MIKSDIVNRVAERSEVPRVKAAAAVDIIIEAMKTALTQGKRIELRGFGVFQVRDRKRGIGRNPKTGVEVAIAPAALVAQAAHLVRQIRHQSRLQHLL